MLPVLASVFATAAVISQSNPATPAVLVPVTGETAGVADQGDSDDPAVWIDRADQTQSLIIGTYKEGGLALFNLKGQLLQFLADGEFNNVDLRYGFRLGDRLVDLVAATNRRTDSIDFYEVDPVARQLVRLGAHPLGYEPYGVCLYQGSAGGTSVFLPTKTGRIEQLKLDGASGKVEAQLVRTLSLPTQTEGCVADDGLDQIFVGEENVGLWRFDARPDGPSAGTLVDSVAGGRLVADVEGLAIAAGDAGAGHLVVSSQGSSEFAVYDRVAPHTYRGRFALGPGSGDAVTKTDGLEIVTADLGGRFSRGLLVAHDDDNQGGEPNFKLVAWSDVLEKLAPR
jgi:3-phytase